MNFGHRVGSRILPTGGYVLPGRSYSGRPARSKRGVDDASNPNEVVFRESGELCGKIDERSAKFFVAGSSDKQLANINVQRVCQGV